MTNRFNFIPDNGVTGFVVIFRGRSGSTFLTSKLGSHPQILCHSELFARDSIGLSPQCKGKEEYLHLRSVQQRNKNPWEFLREIYSHHGNAQAVGFKIGFNQNKRILLSILLNKRIKKIILQRENSLDSYTSLLIARKSSVWAIPSQSTEHPQSNAQNRQPIRIRIEPGAFQRYAISTKLFFVAVDSLLWFTRQKWIDIEYKQINDRAKMDVVLKLLGIEPGGAELHSDIKKQNPMNQEERIENYEELKLKLRNSKYARYLTSP